MDSEPTVRVGVIGAGLLGISLGRQLENDGRADVVAIADPSADSSTEARRAFSLEESAAYEDHGAMLAQEELDAVVIATPHTLHYDQILDAVEAGCHVLCEKPLVTGVEDAAAIVDRSRAGDELIMPGYQRHFDPTFVAARDWWQDTDAPPTGLVSTITQDWIGEQRGTWRTDPDLSGGGFCYDTGSHVLDALLWITDLEPTAVRAEMTFDDPERRVDSAASLLVDFEADVTATVALTGDANDVYESHQFWTADGGLRITGEGWGARDLEVVTGDWRSKPRPRDSPGKIGAFLDAVIDGAELPVSPYDALKTTAVTEAAYASARSGEREPIGIDLAEYAPE
jgi:predicted dehydrogenase